MAENFKLELFQIKKEFNNGKTQIEVLRDISCHIYSNEFAVFLGPSGCGKTTLLRIICSLDDQFEGKLLIDGKVPQQPGLDRGIVFQSYTSFPWLTVKQNIEFGLKKLGLTQKDRQKMVKDWISDIGLKGFEKAYSSTLSGGMRQRVAIARTLATNPDILLLDEPFGALDAQTRSQMQEMLLEIWENHKTTVIFVTHDLDEAIYLADRIFVMSERPAIIKHVEEIKLTRPRKKDIFLSDDFLSIKKKLYKEFTSLK